MLRCVLIILALASIVMAQNIVQNPGFESGSFAPWVNNSGGEGWDVDTGSARTGTFFASTGCVGASCINADPNVNGSWFYQNLPTTPGAKYTLTFWFFPGVSGEGGTAELQVLWGPAATPLTLGPAGTCGGNCVYRDATIGSTTYTQVTVTNLTATSASTRLEFLGRQDPASNGVDDVSVVLTTPAPSVTTPNGAPALTTWGLVVLALGLLLFGGRHLACGGRAA